MGQLSFDFSYGADSRVSRPHPEGIWDSHVTPNKKYTYIYIYIYIFFFLHSEDCVKTCLHIHILL
jgi:hypothetical protein